MSQLLREWALKGGPIYATEARKAVRTLLKERDEACGKVEAAIGYCDYLDSVTEDDYAIEDLENERRQSAESTRLVADHFRAILSPKEEGK